MKNIFKIIFILIIIFFVSSFLLSDSKVEGNNHNHPSYGGSLVWGTTNPPEAINPIITQYSISCSLMELLFNALLRVDKQGNIRFDLVQRMDVSDDEKEYIFYLKKGVKFHDGKALTAEDVKFTYEMIADPQNNSPWRTGTELIDSWQVIDPLTIKMVLKKTFPRILYELTREIVPQHLLAGQPLATAAFNNHPVGTGPFRFKKWDKEENEIRLQANTDYFEGRPYLDEIIVKTYVNQESLWAALMRQEIDLVRFISKKNYSILEKDPSFKVYKIPFRFFCALAYNPHDSILFDKEVRRAIALTINVPEIMDQLSVEGTVSTGPFHPDSEGYNPEVHYLGYNPLKAKMNLMHRGWYDRDNDGILEKGGRELEVKIMIDGRNQFFKKMAMLIRQQLAEVGIKLKINFYASGEDLTRKNFDENKTQGLLRFFMGHSFGDYEGYEVISSWYSLSSEHGKVWNYRNKEVDRLFEKARSTKDKKEKISLYRQIHKILYEDQPACFLFFPETFHAVSEKFANTEELFSTHMPEYTIKNWYISKHP